MIGTATADAPPGQLSQYHVQIDWGDGSTDDETEDEPFGGNEQGIATKGFSGSHTYSVDGDYTITAKIYHQTVPGQDGNGDDSFSLDICVGDDEEPTDLCPNIDGIQETVPEGYEINEQDQCVLIEEPAPTVNLNFTKIVCDDESYLPNWGGGVVVDADTATDFLATDDNAEHCELQDDWYF